MNRSHPIPGAVALAACLFSFFATAWAPAHAGERLPDPRILSAAPFMFHADSAIFSRMPGDTSDINILKPRETLRNAGHSSSTEDRFKRRIAL